MKNRFYTVLLVAVTALALILPVTADALSSVEKLGKDVALAALEKLDAKPDSSLACFTNAGYVKHNGKSTRILLDVLPRHAPVSLGQGNLLVVHTRSDASLWFAFVKKGTEKQLMLTYVSMDENGFHLSDPIDVRVEIGQDYKAFGDALGRNAFSIINFANGWADGLPEDLMQGALYHDHLCCGVSTGYFTAGFIQKKLPLSPGERYLYIGAPSWCQDDYIMRPLNLTPGKGGYYTMAYPWSRPWKTADAVYKNLGGIVIRFDNRKNTGKAYVLKFNWQEDAFKQFINRPDFKVEWRGNSWLHVVYNRFFITHQDEPELFVSVVKEKELNNKKDLDRLIRVGANPLAEVLGVDQEWAGMLHPE